MEVNINNNEAAALKLEDDNLKEIDSLASISNRSSFIFNCRKIILQNKDSDYYLIRFDINKFRYINQVYGYKYGDMILNYISEILERLTNNDELYARGYDDNFLLLLNVKDNDFDIKLKSIIQELKNLEHKIDKSFKLNYSFGVYRIKDLDENVESMIDKAYIAQKFIKSSGNYKKYYEHYIEDMRESLIEEKIIEDKMHNALKNKEFKVYLQSKNDINTLQTIGAEALVRWKDSQNEIIYPDKFIPLFEKNGFVVEIDFYVFEEVCRYIKKLMILNKKIIPISINQSKKHLENKDYFCRVKNIMDKYNIPEGLIEFEITESSALDNMDILIDVVDRFHHIGIKIAIDDFGTGYSSLKLLQEMNVDTLKIDREFLNRINSSHKSKIIMKYIINMAEELNVVTVAEGIENKEQEEFLKEIGCRVVQGYLYSKPIPIDEFNKIHYSIS